MQEDLKPAEEKLAHYMSQVSERCYHAGWMVNLEYVLWDAMIRGERSYGHDSITQEDIDTLKSLSETADCWIVFDDHEEETAVDLRAWEEKFVADTAKNLNLLNG